MVVIETADDASDYSGRRSGVGKAPWERGKDRGGVGGGRACSCPDGTPCTCGTGRAHCHGGMCGGGGADSKSNGRRPIKRFIRKWVGRI